VIQGNLIGFDETGTTPLGNGFGVIIGGNRGSSGSTVAANTIAFNDVIGISVDSGTGNRVLGNSVFANGGLGLDLRPSGRTPNDPGDVDAGGNALQNTPELDVAFTDGGATVIRGFLDSTPNRSFWVQFFANPPGGDEGKTFSGEAAVRAADFQFVAPRAIAAGRMVTATATDQMTGDTSELSRLETVVAISDASPGSV
jgi:parallel beta-helix repeat protein